MNKNSDLMGIDESKLVTYVTNSGNINLNGGNINLNGDNINSNIPTLSSTITPIKYKYNEHHILSDLKNYIDKTYDQHYKKDNNIECFDAWIARGTASTTFLDTAEKYLWRYGSKNGKDKDDLMKTLHYVMLIIYNDHYRKGE